MSDGDDFPIDGEDLEGFAGTAEGPAAEDGAQAEGGMAEAGAPAGDLDLGAGAAVTVAEQEPAAAAGVSAPERQEGTEGAGDAAQPAEGGVFRVKIMYSSSTEFCMSSAGMSVAVGDLVVVPSKHGNELGRILGVFHGPVDAAQGDLHPIVRKATQADLTRIGENEMMEEKAFTTCRDKIYSRNLEMKLVSAHYLLDEQKILFFFTAENRIDFRELVKDLVSVFKMRIELRQIGVRDEARVIGGVGICGRVLCCNAVTDRLRPVSIKMAKEQNLTLNSMKISGPCGRLLCCLSYEFDVYREARQQLPALGTRIPFDGEEFKVSDLNVLARRIRFQSVSGRVLDLGFESLGRNPATNAWEIRMRTTP
jgi:cell fate regulator YaaT (PSP1 superfamily)